MTALIRNFYKTVIKRMNVKDFGLSATSRIKTFVFKFISVLAKWIKTSREYRLNIYTVNSAYARVFNASDSFFSYGLDSVLSQVALWGKGKIRLKKHQTDSHVIYGTLKLEIFTKYTLITRESRLFAEIRI